MAVDKSYVGSATRCFFDNEECGGYMYERYYVIANESPGIIPRVYTCTKHNNLNITHEMAMKKYEEQKGV